MQVGPGDVSLAREARGQGLAAARETTRARRPGRGRGDRPGGGGRRRLSTARPGPRHGRAPRRTRGGGNAAGRHQPHQLLREPAAAPALPCPYGRRLRPRSHRGRLCIPSRRWLTKHLSMGPGGGGSRPGRSHPAPVPAAAAASAAPALPAPVAAAGPMVSPWAPARRSSSSSSRRRRPLSG